MGGENRAENCVIGRPGAGACAGNPLAAATDKYVRMAKAECVAQKGRVAKSERATREGVLDDGTRRLILRLINLGALEEVTGAVKTGKESRVYHGLGSVEELRAVLSRPGTGTARVTIIENEDSSAEIKYEAAGEVSGLVAGVGQRVLLGVAKHLVRQFFSTLKKEFDEN